jgi:endonuclease YncB( thermonuclease family)
LTRQKQNRRLGTAQSRSYRVSCSASRFSVEIEDKDRYGRTVGRVFVGEIAINLEMVRHGFAWWYRSSAKKSVDLASAESEARKAGRGLWVDKAPVAPWDFRKSTAATRRARSFRVGLAHAATHPVQILESSCSIAVIIIEQTA